MLSCVKWISFGRLSFTHYLPSTSHFSRSMAEQSDFNQPNLPIELFRYIAANAHPAAAAKLRRLSWAHCAAITTADLATAAARHIWKGRNTHVADLWPKIYRRYGDFPDIVYLVLEALVVRTFPSPTQGSNFNIFLTGVRRPPSQRRFGHNGCSLQAWTYHGRQTSPCTWRGRILYG